MDEEKKKALYHTPLLICWQFFKDFWEPDGSEDFWQRVIAQQGAIYEQFDRSQFVLELSRVFVNEIERIEQRKINGGNTK